MKHTHWLYDPNSISVLLYTANNRTILNCLKEGAKLHMDNQWFLAMHTFHQHKLPTREGYYAFNYPRNEDGTPHYPQRDILIAHTFTEAASGRGIHTGNNTGKMIVIDNLLDNKAFLWEADWYQIEEKWVEGQVLINPVFITAKYNLDPASLQSFPLKAFASESFK